MSGQESKSENPSIALERSVSLEAAQSTGELLLCDLAEVKATGSLTRFYEDLRDELILFVSASGGVECFSSVCPHMAGEVVRSDSGQLHCKWHGLNFDANGKATNCKAALSLRKYETIVRGGKVFVTYVA